MKVLVTGAKGFIGKNLCLTLRQMKDVELLEYDLDSTPEDLDRYLAECDFVMHLAGVNRPQDPSEYTTGNAVFTEDILDKLVERGAKTPFLLSSSIQAELDNPYGISKRAAEDAVRDYAKRSGALIYIYRLANVFGKWCRPNYNSAVATWCHNIARCLPIMVRDESAKINLVYIDDVVADFVSCLSNREHCPYTIEGACISVLPTYHTTLGEVVALLQAFHSEPRHLMVPDQRDEFAKKLYATYLSYLPEDRFAYPLTMHCDARGSFTEILHSVERGQVSVNVSKPGIVKGQHWHHTKHEKFCVVSGKGLIQFRKMDGSTEVLDYHVSGDKIEVVRIPPGYTHNIINEGDTDMVTLMWANEVFDPGRPDTFREEV